MAWWAVDRRRMSVPVSAAVGAVGLTAAAVGDRGGAASWGLLLGWEEELPLMVMDSCGRAPLLVVVVPGKVGEVGDASGVDDDGGGRSGSTLGVWRDRRRSESSVSTCVR